MSQEREVVAQNGWKMLLGTIITLLLMLEAFVLCISLESPLPFIIIGVLLFITASLLSWGLFSLQPNEARVLVLFGNYKGTVRKDGFHWANPFSVHRSPFDPTKQPCKYLISLRSRNFETQTVKVNDQRGNPIEIGAVVV